jgi:hypothetical protein
MAGSPEAFTDTGRPEWVDRLKINPAKLPLLMPYVYVAVLTAAVLILEPSLIDGPGALTANFALVVPLALVSFGQTLVMLTRGIDLSIGGVISLSSALLATHLAATGWLPSRAPSLSLRSACDRLPQRRDHRLHPIQPFIVTLATWSIWDGVAFRDPAGRRRGLSRRRSSRPCPGACSACRSRCGSSSHSSCSGAGFARHGSWTTSSR